MNLSEKNKRRLKSKWRHKLKRKERRRIEKLKSRMQKLFGIAMCDTKLQIERKSRIFEPAFEAKMGFWERIKSRIIKFFKEKILKKKYVVKEEKNLQRKNLVERKELTPGRKMFKEYNRRKR
jgi:hypothetical protein